LAAARACVKSKAFDTFMCTIIIANSVAIGLEQSLRLEHKDTTAFVTIDHMFLVVYVFELLMRVYALRRKSLRNGWIRFDSVLVLVGILGNWVLPPLLGSAETLASLLVLRTARLLRLVRTVVLVTRLRELWMLVEGLLNSFSTLVHILLLCGVLVYVFGCMSIELVPLALAGREEVSDQVTDIINTNFSSLPMAMLTLVQFITFDNVVYIYQPLIEADFLLLFFFIPVMTIIGVVFMNLVTAVVVNGALEQAMTDKDMQRAIMEDTRKKLLRELKEAFERVDTNQSGDISREELAQIDEEDKAMLRRTLGIDDLVRIFNALDVDENGSISIDEFVGGIESVVISNTSLDLMRLLRMMESMHRQMLKSLRAQKDLSRSLMLMTHGRAEMEEKEEDKEGRERDEGDASECSAALGSDAGGAADGAAPITAWADRLMARVQRTCAEAVQRSLEEACRSIMEEVDDAAAPIHGIRGSRASSICSSMGTETCEFYQPWQPLPPTQEALHTGGDEPLTEPRPSPACGHQRSSPAADAQMQSPSGVGRVPASATPVLLSTPDVTVAAPSGLVPCETGC